VVLIAFLIHLFEQTCIMFGHVGSAVVDTAEAGMRAPLEMIGLKGIPQTLVLALVPLLTLIATIKLLGGAIRFIVAVVMVGALLRVLWPLVGEVSKIV
jgi:hypothetical protein